MNDEVSDDAIASFSTAAHKRSQKGSITGSSSCDSFGVAVSAVAPSAVDYHLGSSCNAQLHQGLPLLDVFPGFRVFVASALTGKGTHAVSKHHSTPLA